MSMKSLMLLSLKNPMWLKNVKYLLSAPSKTFWPKDEKKEICIVGRSNVGKSTLINKMTNNKNMAKVSKTPGLTKYLNFFDIDQTYRLVDTPGYGYAKTSKNGNDAFAQMMHEYLYERKNLIAIVLIIDAKVGFTNNDILLLDMVQKANHKTLLVTSKTDQLNQKMKHQLKKQVQECNEHYGFMDVIYYSKFDDSYQKATSAILSIFENESVVQ